MTLTTACHKYFGKKEGQTLSQFAVELKALTEKDKHELAVMLEPIMGEIVTVE